MDALSGAIAKIREGLKEFGEALDGIEKARHAESLGAVSDILLDDGEMMNPAAAARMIGVQRKTLANWRSMREGPPFQKVGVGVRYLRSEVQEWLDSQHSTNAG